MLKKMGKFFAIIAFVFVVLFLVLYVLINYYGGLTGKVVKGDNFCVNKEYSIGKILGGGDFKFFCHNKVKNKCLGGIKGYVLGPNDDLYLSFELPMFAGKSKDEINDMLKVDNPKGFNYDIFQNDYENEYYAKNYNEVVRFLKLSYSDCKITFYNDLDFSNLSVTEKNVFSKINY